MQTVVNECSNNSTAQQQRRRRGNAQNPNKNIPDPKNAIAPRSSFNHHEKTSPPKRPTLAQSSRLDSSSCGPDSIDELDLRAEEVALCELFVAVFLVG